MIKAIETNQRIAVNSNPKNDASNNVIGILTIAEVLTKVKITLSQAPFKSTFMPRCFSTFSRETQTSNNPIKIKAQGTIFIM
jgi:hypothetical protein